jgi:anti-sigma regulatory factor (Ser/Thr protein kinase)
MIQSILYNLLSNAIKYRSPERGLEITVTTHHKGNETILKVRDNGLGIDLASHQRNVFKLYRRFHTHVTGKGLGLYLVKTQMDALGGTIEVQSELNVGTTFITTFPDVVNINEQVFFENDAAKLSFDANINNTIIEWKRNISSEEYHEVFESVLQTLRTYNTPAWIADLRKQGAVDELDQKWFMSTVLPQAVSCGLKRIGTIGFLDPIRQNYYQHMQIKTRQLGIELQVFSTMEDAKAWMSACLAETGSFPETV